MATKPPTSINWGSSMARYAAPRKTTWDFRLLRGELASNRRWIRHLCQWTHPTDPTRTSCQKSGWPTYTLRIPCTQNPRVFRKPQPGFVLPEKPQPVKASRTERPKHLQVHVNASSEPESGHRSRGGGDHHTTAAATGHQILGTTLTVK